MVGACVDAPDLTVSSVSAKFEKYPNGSSFISVAVTVTNKGKVDTDKTFWTTAKYYNEALNSNAYSYSKGGPLAPGENKTVTFVVPAMEPNYLKCPSKGNVTVVTDANNEVAESNEWNNQNVTTLDC